MMQVGEGSSVEKLQASIHPVAVAGWTSRGPGRRASAMGVAPWRWKEAQPCHPRDFKCPLCSVPSALAR